MSDAPSQPDPTVGHVLFTGGGSGGHVVPNLPVMEQLAAKGWQLSYLGSANGPERALIEPTGVPFYAISTGKLRRYLSWQNLIDVFRTLRGLWQAWRLLGRLRPDLVFSKGGFVTVPPAIAAWLRGIPVIVHESDTTPGLANRLILPIAAVVCTNFPGQSIRTRRLTRTPLEIVHTGTPLRPALLQGDAARGRAAFGFADENRPILLVVGGSLGARVLNELVWTSLPALTERFNVVHIYGQGEVPAKVSDNPSYRAYAYVNAGWGDMLAAADLILSRAGANALYELLALRKPHVLVPLTRAGSRGDQLENAAFAEAAGYSVVVQESRLNTDLIMSTLVQMLAELPAWRARLTEAGFGDGTAAVVDLIEQVHQRRSK